ncbi:hypothetical protein AMECASPLE_001912 [Ameca splendens]|uniref:Uncharacterized protein n=1 Tax=Ameca splendens TaxID=208324 RepID=A0ABV0ZU33_9TELE
MDLLATSVINAFFAQLVSMGGQSYLGMFVSLNDGLNSTCFPTLLQTSHNLIVDVSAVFLGLPNAGSLIFSNKLVRFDTAPWLPSLSFSCPVFRLAAFCGSPVSF